MEAQKKNILIFGKTGAGKSTISNVLSGTSNFKESADMSSETKVCQVFEGPFLGDTKNEMAKIIDTPGFMDSTGSDNNTLEAIYEMLAELGNQGFNIGLFCFSACEMRCDGGIKEALRLITSLMSSDVLKHIYIVITQINKLHEHFGQEQEKKIKTQVPQILGESGYELNYSKIFVYQHGQKNHGLEELIPIFQSSSAFVPQICHDFVRSYVAGDKYQTMKNLGESSQQMQLALAFMNEMKASRELQERQIKEMNEKMMQAIQQQQSNWKEMQKEMKEQHRLEREELKQQKATEMELMKKESYAREQLIQKNNQEMLRQLQQQNENIAKANAQLQQQVHALASRPPQIIEKEKGCSIF